ALDIVLELLQPLLAVALLLEERARAHERVALLVLFELRLRAVLRGIAHRVSAEAIRAHLDERRQRELARALHRLADLLLHLEHVVREEAIAIDAVAERLHRDVLDAHRARERSAHRVLVVLADEDDGELPQRGERHALVESRDRHRALAEEAE